MTKARDIASAIPAPSTVSSAELGYLDGVTSAIQTQLDAKTAKSTLTTTGDIYYASAANTPARLAIGSTSNVLTVAGGIPSWAAPAAGGKVLQVVQGTTTTATTITTSTMTDTTITATITPTLNTSKILIMMTSTLYTGKSGTTTYASSNARMLRDATVILTYNPFQQNEGASASGGVSLITQANMVYLDSPATTSATTYKIQGNCRNASSIIWQQKDSAEPNATGVIILMEIGA